VPSDRRRIILEMRLLAAMGLIGIWNAAASLGGPLVLTASYTLGAVALGAWAIAVLRE
jgi:GTPase involved in cell partitioning and DNA repair